MSSSNKPFIPSVQRLSTLIIMALVSIACLTIALNMQSEFQSKSYDTKIRAANRMLDAMNYLKSIRMDHGVFVDIENDPNETGLVGTQFSLITTDEGDLDAKLTTLDPNFAAVAVELMSQAGIESGDTVAVLLTGSMPGGNIAVLIACEEMGVTPVTITSIGASQWGANYTDFNWLDMERLLYDEKYISYRSIAASIGGRNDLGRLLSPRGRQLIEESIEEHEVELIKFDRLSENVDYRMSLFKEITPIYKYDGMINVGGGVASLGTTFNHKLLNPGVIRRSDIEVISRHGGIEGVMSRFSKENVPVVHLLNIFDLTEQLKIPFAPIPWPEIGEGQLYSVKRYNMIVSVLCFLIVAGMTSGVGYLSHKQIKGRMNEHEPDSVL